MDLMNMNNVALGGALAAVVGFWGQVKNAVRYLSSWLVIQADVDQPQMRALMNVLKADFKVAPSGLRSYRSLFVQHQDGLHRDVPYRGLNSTTVFYRGLSVVVVVIGASDVQRVYAPRMFVNLEALICQGLQGIHEASIARRQKESRFTIYDIMGREKGMFANRYAEGKEVAPTGGSSPQIAESSVGRNLLMPDPNHDHSFMYSREELTSIHDEDPFNNLFYDDDVMEHVKDAEQWLDSAEWYRVRNIPWRRAWLAHGLPGTGKSSLGLAMAKKLRIPIYTFHLSTLSDREFIENWKSMVTPCLALFEDFDAVFKGRVNQTEHKSLSFDTILNQISGVNTMNGVFLFVTTNHIENIDPAMGVESSERKGISTRPGRIDQVIYLGKASEKSRRRIAQSILRDWPECVESMVANYDGVTPVQFQEICIQKAFDKMREAEDAKTAKAQEGVAIKYEPGKYAPPGRILQIDGNGGGWWIPQQEAA